MLVMSRRAGDTILIGDDIEIVIAHIGRSRVKVGIRAPRALPVIAREEKLVRDENVAAVASRPAPSVLTAVIARLHPEAIASSPAAPLQALLPRADKSSVRKDTGTQTERTSK